MTKNLCVFQPDGRVRLHKPGSDCAETVGEYYGPHRNGQDWLFIHNEMSGGWIKARTRAELGDLIDQAFGYPAVGDTLQDDWAKCRGSIPQYTRPMPLRPDLIETPRMAQDRVAREN